MAHIYLGWALGPIHHLTPESSKSLWPTIYSGWINEILVKNELIHNHYCDFMSNINHRLVWERRHFERFCMKSGYLKSFWGNVPISIQAHTLFPLQNFKVYYLIMYTFNNAPSYCIVWLNAQLNHYGHLSQSLTMICITLPAVWSWFSCLQLWYISHNCQVGSDMKHYDDYTYFSLLEQLQNT